MTDDQDKIAEASGDPDLVTWNEFCKENPRVVAKAMGVFENMVRQQAMKRPALTILMQAMWMSCLVSICVGAFAPMFSGFVSFIIGAGACVLVDKTLDSTARTIVGWLHKKKFDQLDEDRQREEKENGGGSGDHDG